MIKYKLTTSVIILSVIFFSIFASAVQVVEVNQPTTPAEKPSMFAFLKSPLFWWIIIGLAVLTIFLVLLFFLVRWLVKFIKQRNDIFWKLKSNRMALAKVHRRYPSTHWWKTEKNTPIKLVNKNEEGKLIISNTIAYHRGDCLTHEGNLILWVNLVGKKQYYFFPASDILVIPNKAEIKIVQRNDRGERIRDETFKLPTAKDIIQFNENEILLFAEGISNVGIFMIPVLKAKDGKIIDLALPTYASLQEVIIGDFLYEQSSSFVGLTKKAVDMNVELRGKTKLNDANQNVELSSGNN